MELDPIKDAFDRVIKRQKLSSAKCQEIVQKIEEEIAQVLSRIHFEENSATPLDHNSVLSSLNLRLKTLDLVTQLEGAQKELNAAASKYAKLLEKSFNPEISRAYRNVNFDTHQVNQIIASHFYREGLFDLGDCFVDETSEPEALARKSPFLELFHIMEAMRSRDLEPAINWATEHREQLMENDSNIELKLHRLQFVEILQKNRDEALKYARSVFAPFAEKHLSEIQKLMACLLWAGKLDSSPYTELLSSVHWDKLADELKRQFCNLMGQSYDSPLSVTVAAGFQALPTLLKLMNVMSGKKQEWQTMMQLPVPTDLCTEFHFHSVFVCPVSRDQATEENPPMLLPCGHTLCKQSITKLSKNNSRPFKCPYCPSEVEAGQCKQLFF